MTGISTNEPPVADRTQEDALRAVSDWILAQALGDIEMDAVFNGFCDRLTDAGLKILRGHLAVTTLHPLVGATSYRWWRGAASEQVSHRRVATPSAEWEQSPLRRLLADDVPEIRFSLEDDESGWRDYPLLVDLRKSGVTEYLGMRIAFSTQVDPSERMDGMLSSWATDRAGGFSEDDLAALRHLQPRLGAAVKMAKREQTAVNILTAYFGSGPGRRVLEGHIERGDVETVQAAIWFCDLRGSTPLAERLPAHEFIALLNSYFECTAGAVLDHGGEVLRFVGDAVLAIFRADGPGGDSRAARMALAAARDAEKRVDRLNETRRDQGDVPIDFGLALHIGEVLFGNVGVPERVDFTVVGSAVNEAARLEGLTKTYARRVLVSNAFSRLLPIDWESLGEAALRGVNRGRRVYAPPPDV